MKSIPEIADELLTYLTEKNSETSQVEFAEMIGESERDILAATDMIDDYNDSFILVTEPDSDDEIKIFSHSESATEITNFLHSGGFKKLRGI